MRDVSSNDSEKEIEELESEDEELESVDEELESDDEELESDDEILELDDDVVVKIPLQFEREGELYEIQAVTLASDRATSTVDYSGYFENLQVCLSTLIAMNLAFAMVVCFLLGVKK